MDGGAALSSNSTAEDRGGDAGTITVAADDMVQLIGGATLSTDAVSGGGGKDLGEGGDRRLPSGQRHFHQRQNGGGGRGGISGSATRMAWPRRHMWY